MSDDLDSIEQKNFCVAPWVMLHVDSLGARRLCCEASPAPKEYSSVSFEDFFHSPYMKEKRSEFLQGKYPKECRTCEKATHKTQTFQSQLNEMFQANLPEILAATTIDGNVQSDPFFQGSFGAKYVDYRRLACNFSCATCGPDYSSKWRKELKSWKGYQPYHMEELPSFDLFDDEEKRIAQLPNVDVFYFAGGEPFMRTQHLEFLKNIHPSRKHKVRLIYNTNLSLTESQLEPFFEVWSKFQEVWIFCSVDGLGKLGELVRKGFQSERFTETFLRLEKRFRSTKIHFSIDFTLTSYFFFQLREFSNFLLSHQGHYQGKYMMGRQKEAGFLRTEYLPLRVRTQLVSEWEDYLRCLQNEEKNRLEDFRKLLLSHIQLGEFSGNEISESENAVEFQSKISGRHYLSLEDLLKLKAGAESKQQKFFDDENALKVVGLDGEVRS